MCGWQRGGRRMRQTRLTVYENIRPFEFRELRSACALQPRLAAALIELRSSCALEYQILGGIELRLAGALRIPHMKSSFLSLSKFGFSAQNLLSPLSPTGTMPYIIPHVRNLEDSAPRMLIGHRLLPEMHPLRRFEEQKRLVYDRDYAYMCLVGIIPPKEQGGRRPERRLPPAPLPPGSRASKFLRKLLPSDPPASGLPSPRSPGTIFRRNAAAGSPKNLVVPVTQEPSAATWNRVFGRIPPRVLKAIPESINNITMIPHSSNEDDLCLVPLGSENAIPTVRGIIEEYHEEREYEQTEQTSLKEKRTPVYLSPKLAQYTAEAIRKSNLKNHPVSSSARLPPKAHQLLGSPQPTNNNSDSTHVEHVEQTPLHTKGNPTTSLRHSASFRVASLLTPTKARKSSTSSLAQSKVVQHTSSSSHHTTFSHKHTATSSSSSPLKHSSFLSTVSSRNKMSAQPSPTKQATAGAPSNKSLSESSKSPVKSHASPKKEDFSLKRALSNAFTPRHEDVPPPLPKKDTPPPANDKPAHLRMSANIVDVRGPFDAYSGNGFAATVEDAEDEAPTNKSRETITVAFGDECSPVKQVKSGVVKMAHAAYSPFIGQKAVFEADPEIVQKIQQEFATPPMNYGLFHSPEVEKKSPKSAQKAMTPRYIAGGLLEGGLLPATTYQPPPPKISEKIKPQSETYSPSMYSVATGNDVFNVSLQSSFSGLLFFVFAPLSSTCLDLHLLVLLPYRPSYLLLLYAFLSSYLRLLLPFSLCSFLYPAASPSHSPPRKHGH
jgi:hypothetical protein